MLTHVYPSDDYRLIISLLLLATVSPCHHYDSTLLMCSSSSGSLALGVGERVARSAAGKRRSTTGGAYDQHMSVTRSYCGSSRYKLAQESRALPFQAFGLCLGHFEDATKPTFLTMADFRVLFKFSHSANVSRVAGESGFQH